MELDTAKKTIQDLKLKLGNVKYEFNDNVAAGKVISQTPDVDAELKEGEEISLVISNGPEIKYSTVPNLIGKSIGAAQNALANAGLYMGSSKAIITEDQSLDGQVASQSIGAGQSVKQGSSVSISYYKYKKPEVKPDPKPDNDNNSGDNNNSQNNGSNNGSGSGSGGGSGSGSGSGSGGGSGSGSGGGSGSGSGDESGGSGSGDESGDSGSGNGSGSGTQSGNKK